MDKIIFESLKEKIFQNTKNPQEVISIVSISSSTDFWGLNSDTYFEAIDAYTGKEKKKLPFMEIYNYQEISKVDFEKNNQKRGINKGNLSEDPSRKSLKYEVGSRSLGVNLSQKLAFSLEGFPFS